ncbi:mechanosensitive ion channel family protein [Haladaptatus sp. CMAA 1911]|uniref:mechanosensitive ion channel family protein n=1 Tax=unclassified Haladaptatus TaxID=2622732 RepID=UPI0037553276
MCSTLPSGVTLLALQASEPDIAARYQTFLYKLLVFAVTFVLVSLLARVAAIPLIERLLNNERVSLTVRRPAIRTARVVSYFVAFVLGLFFARLESLLTVTGGFAAALTLAIGFASRDILNNVVGGLFMITDPKFNIGDWIEWKGESSVEETDGAETGSEGIIQDISFRATRVRTFRNELITVPNSTLANTVVTNHDIKDRLRIDHPFSVMYDGDIDAMRTILLEEAQANPRILTDPEPTVIVDGVTAAGIDMISRFWISSPSREKYLSVRSAYFQAVKERFEREGFEMSPDLLEVTGDVDFDTTEVAVRAGDRETD